MATAETLGLEAKVRSLEHVVQAQGVTIQTLQMLVVDVKDQLYRLLHSNPSSSTSGKEYMCPLGCKSEGFTKVRLTQFVLMLAM